MALYIGNNANEPTDIYLGSNKIKEIYLGNELVYPQSVNYILVGSKIFAYSKDAINWTTLSGDDVPQGMPVFFKNKFFCFPMFFSQSGINWEKNQIIMIGGDFVANDDIALNLYVRSVKYSYDGITWVSKSNSFSNDFYLSSRTVLGNGKFVTINQSKMLTGTTFVYYPPIAAYSSNGIDWIEKSIPYTEDISIITGNPITPILGSICYGNGKFIIFPEGGMKSLAYSLDGINWNKTDSPAYSNLLSSAYGNGIYIAIKYNNTEYIYSYNGINWNIAELPSRGNWDNTVFVRNKFFTFDFNRNLYSTSSNGINWTEINLPESPTTSKWTNFLARPL
jgi:hypothetical protein